MNKIFGSKESFAIEIGNLVPEKKSAKLRLWVSSIPIGTFRVNFTLKYAVKSFEELIEGQHSFYDKEFDLRSPQQIFTLCLLLDRDLDSDWKNEWHEQFNRYKKFSPFFGDQLDDSALMLYVKDSSIYFLWSTNTDYSKAKIDYLEHFKSATTSYASFANTSKEFINWYKNSILLN